MRPGPDLDLNVNTPATRSAHDHAYAGVRVAVLGASGFIGRWLTRALWEAGAETGLLIRDAVRARRVLADHGTRDATLIEVDLTEPLAVRKAMASFRPSVTFNATGYGVDDRERDASLGMRINGEMVHCAAQAAADCLDREWPGAHFVQLGSALEYGTAGGDLIETTPPNPTTWYGTSKLAGTRHLEAVCRRSPAFRGVTARLFMVYGPGEHAGRLFPTLISAASSNDMITLSAGHQKKDFTYVEDAAQGCLRLGASAAREGEVVNLATGKLTMVRRFVEMAADELDLRANRLEFGAVEVRPGEMNHDPVRLDRLRSLTGWAPSTSIQQGIRATLTFLRSGCVHGR